MDLFHSFSENSDEITLLNSNLLRWFNKNKRDMPWRDLQLVKNQQQHAYRVLVSEVMLQQTQVSTVIPYYKRWMKRWPNLEDLSEADGEDVQEAWKGLGYYSRGRRLLELAKRIKDTEGKLPESVDKLVTLPGIGKYTAGAVASIAFGKRAAAVDGNVQRVLCRLRGIGGCIGTASVLKVLWDLAYSLVPDSEPGEWNQAIMELGSTICKPRNPSCGECPIQSHCHAFNHKSHDIEDCNLCLPPSVTNPSPTDYPRKTPKKSARIEREVTCVITVQQDKRRWFYLVKRDSSGLLADLWQFPSFSTDLKEETKLERSAKTLLRKHCHVTGKVRSSYVGKVSHKFSHISMTYEVVYLELVRKSKLHPPANCCNAEWMDEIDIESRPISTAMSKVFQIILQKKLKNSS